MLQFFAVLRFGLRATDSLYRRAAFPRAKQPATFGGDATCDWHLDAFIASTDHSFPVGYSIYIYICVCVCMCVRVLVLFHGNSDLIRIILASL